MEHSPTPRGPRMTLARRPIPWASGRLRGMGQAALLWRRRPLYLWWPCYNRADSTGKEVAQMADKGQKSNKEKKKPKKTAAEKTK